MEKIQKFGYKFQSIENENKAEVATEQIFKNIPFSYLIYLEKCLFNGSGIEGRKKSIKNNFISFFKYGNNADHNETGTYIYGIFRVKINNIGSYEMVANTIYEPYYRSIMTKEETVVQDVRVYTGIQTKFIFKDYGC